jgi:hypothetical protein
VAFRSKKIDDAIRQIEIAAEDRATTDDAVRVLATSTRLLRAPDRAAAPLLRLARTNDLALLESSRLAATARFPDFAGVSLEAFDAVAISTTCSQGPNSDDATKALHATVEDLRARVAKLAVYDDNAEVYEAVEKMFATTPVLRLALLDATSREERGWVVELNRELTLLQRSDKAWQTTQIAAIVLQELTVQQAVASADVGKRYRVRLEQLGRELAMLARAFSQGAPLALGPAAPAGKGITVMPGLCSSQLGMPASQVATPAPIPTPPQTKATGCAGCTSGSGSGWFVLVLVAAAVTWSKLRWGTIHARRIRARGPTSTCRR